MRKVTVLDEFKTCARIAQALGISRNAVVNWPDVVPEGSAYKLQVLTEGRLRVQPALYVKKPPRGMAARKARLANQAEQ